MTQRKLFGDFLLGRGVVTEDILLQILVEQMRDQPSIAEIVHREHLLPIEVQLDILRIQNNHQWSYQQACESLGKWEDALVEKIQAVSEANRKPLGQLLLAKALVKPLELASLLDEYLAEVSTAKSDFGQRQVLKKEVA